jgi:hypothetical protein
MKVGNPVWYEIMNAVGDNGIRAEVRHSSADRVEIIPWNRIIHALAVVVSDLSSNHCNEIRTKIRKKINSSHN